MILDIFFLWTFGLGILVNLYRLGYTAANLYMYNSAWAQQNTDANGNAYVQYHSLDYYWNSSDIFDNTYGLINQLIQLVMGPKRLTCIFSLFYIIGFGQLGNWPALFYYAVPWILRFSMDFVLFYVYPALDVPEVPWHYIALQVGDFMGFTLTE